MKRYIGMILATLVLCSAAFSAKAEEEVSPRGLANKFSLTGELKLDLFVPKSKPAFTEQGLFLFAHYKIGDWGIGAGADQWGGTDKTQSNHWTIRSFATVNWKRFYGIVGYSADSRHGDGHAFIGMWFIDRWGRFDVMLDGRYFIGVKSQVSDFVDIFGSVKYAINQKHKVGLEAEHIRWFGQNRDHNWSMVGIVGQRRFNGWSLGIRPAVT